MKTDDLIRALAADSQVGKPPERAILASLAPALAAAVALLWMLLGFREDLARYALGCGQPR